MVWAFEADTAGETRPHLLCSGDYTVGRKEAAILVEDKSVSRKHAVLTIEELREDELSDTSRLPTVRIISLGQFGTCRTNADGEKSLPKNTSVKLCQGDTLRFGQASVFRLRYVKIVLSSPPGSLTPQVKSLASRAGVHLLEAWDESCTHVLIPNSDDDGIGLAAAAATVCGQLANRPVVSENWIKAICERESTTQAIPDTSSFAVSLGKGSDSRQRSHLLSPFSFQCSDGVQLGSHLEAAVKMAGGVIAESGRSESNRQLIMVVQEGKQPEEATGLATTAQLITDALVRGSVANMLQSRNVVPADRGMSRKREREVTEAEVASPVSSDVTACDDEVHEAPPSSKEACEISLPNRVEVKEEQSRSAAATGEVAPSADKETYRGVRDDASGGCQTTTPQKTTGSVKKEPTLGDVKKEGAEGAVCYAINRRPLTVRPYEPTFQGIIEVADSISVVPNFKKFKKAQTCPARDSQPQSYLKSVPWTHPVTAMNTEFLREERARMESDEEAEDLFNVMVPAVRAEPMADPSDDEADAGGPRAGAGRAKPPRPTKPVTNVEGINFESMARRGTLKSLKVPELKAFLSSRGLPVGGKKDELIERIKDSLL